MNFTSLSFPNLVPPLVKGHPSFLSRKSNVFAFRILEGVLCVLPLLRVKAFFFFPPEQLFSPENRVSFLLSGKIKRFLPPPFILIFSPSGSYHSRWILFLFPPPSQNEADPFLSRFRTVSECLPTFLPSKKAVLFPSFPDKPPFSFFTR